MYNAIHTSLSENRGRQLENIVFLELRRKGYEVYFFKNPRAEVDFVIVENHKVTMLIQVSLTMSDQKTTDP